MISPSVLNNTSKTGTAINRKIININKTWYTMFPVKANTNPLTAAKIIKKGPSHRKTLWDKKAKLKAFPLNNKCLKVNKF